jgi:hypothetical protein
MSGSPNQQREVMPMARGVIRGVLAVAGTALAVPALMLIPSAAGTAHAASLPARPATTADPNWVAYTDDPDWVAYTDDSWIGHGNNRGIGRDDDGWIAHGNPRGAEPDHGGIGVDN